MTLGRRFGQEDQLGLSPQGSGRRADEDPFYSPRRSVLCGRPVIHSAFRTKQFLLLFKHFFMFQYLLTTKRLSISKTTIFYHRTDNEESFAKGAGWRSRILFLTLQWRILAPILATLARTKFPSKSVVATKSRVFHSCRACLTHQATNFRIWTVQHS